MQNLNILLVDDDRSITDLLQVILEEAGYWTTIAYTGSEAIKLFKETSPDLMLLDLKLPDISGFEVCRIVREQSQVPIMALSGLKDEEDKVKCLDLGANDYITKPWGNNELLARTRALLRNRVNLSSVFDDGYLRIDFLAQRVTVAGKEVLLTPTEFILLRELVKKPGIIIKYAELFEQAWGTSIEKNIGLLFRHIASLYKKIEPDPNKPRYIINIAKQGYRYDRHH